MRFRSITSEDYESVREFLAEAGWQHRVPDRERFKKMLENTNRTVVALDGARIVGFARALCDEVSNGYISMVAVATDRRGQGIGRELQGFTLVRVDYFSNRSVVFSVTLGRWTMSPDCGREEIQDCAGILFAGSNSLVASGSNNSS